MEEKLIFEALKLIKRGKIIDLEMEFNSKIPTLENGEFPFRMLFSGTPGKIKKVLKEIESNSKASFSTEVVTGPTHISTHIDALCHIQYEDKIYNGYDEKEIRSDYGWTKYGAEKIPIIIGRGVLLDIAKEKGLIQLEDDYEISLKDAKNYLAKYNIKLKKGDIVCIRTGKIRDFYKNDYLKRGPGISVEVAKWLAKNDIRAVGIDYTSIEPNPMKNFNNCVHLQLLYKKGIYIIENLNLDFLAEECVTEVFMVCSAPKFTGCSGSWIRPVAII